MRRFLNKLLRDFRSTGTARGGRRAPPGAVPRVEGLEDRLVLSTARQIGPNLVVTASPGFVGHALPGRPPVAHVRRITLESNGAGQLDVFDSTQGLLGQFSMSSIKTVGVKVAGLDSVIVNDSNGLPFATGTDVSVFGSGAHNSLTLDGSRTISGGETFAAGNGADGSLTLGGDRFGFDSTVGSVTDSVRTTGSLVVKAFGQDVTLTGINGVTQTLSGLSAGGAGDALTFSNKKLVQMEMLSGGATANLSATAGAASEQRFELDLEGANQVAFLNSTPSTVTTDVHADGKSALLLLLANDGPVSMEGRADSLTQVRVEEVLPAGGPTTAFVKANVSVSNVASLLVEDGGNQSTPENVKVTESTITGTGLFGKNAVKLSYSDVASLEIVTGQLLDTYTVAGSHAGARFNSLITIEDGSKKGLAVAVEPDRGSGLTLNLLNNFLTQPAPASLVILAPGATFSQPFPSPGTGVEDLSFAGGLDSDVFFENFTSVAVSNGVSHL